MPALSDGPDLSARSLTARQQRCYLPIGSCVCPASGRRGPVRGKRSGDFARLTLWRRRAALLVRRHSCLAGSLLRQWLRERGIRHRFAHKGIDPSLWPGRRRWAVKATVS